MTDNRDAALTHAATSIIAIGLYCWHYSAYVFCRLRYMYIAGQVNAEYAVVIIGAICRLTD